MSCSPCLFVYTGNAAQTTTTTTAATPTTTTTATTTEEKSATQYNQVTSNILYSNADDPVIGGRALNSGIVDTPAVIACLVVISLLTVKVWLHMPTICP